MVSGKNTISGSGKTGIRSTCISSRPTLERLGSEEDPSVPRTPASPDERQLRRRCLGQAVPHTGRHPPERIRLRGRGARDADGLAGVAPDPRLRVDGDRAEHGNVDLPCELLPAALAEYRGDVVAVRAREPRHVL